MYAVTLVLHSLIRWLFLAALVVTIINAIKGRRDGTAIAGGPRRMATIAVGLADLQLLLGMTLLFAFSPILETFRADPSAAMKTASIRFFIVEHPTMMTAALVALHVGWARAKRATEAKVGWNRVLWSFAIASFLVVASIPWPFLGHGRPLIRLGLG